MGAGGDALAGTLEAGRATAFRGNSAAADSAEDTHDRGELPDRQGSSHRPIEQL
jgi:hypothetical protein